MGTDDLSGLGLNVEIYAVAEPRLKDMSRRAFQIEKYHYPKSDSANVLRFTSFLIYMEKPLPKDNREVKAF